MKKNFRVKVPVEKSIHPKIKLRPAYFSEYFLSLVFLTFNISHWRRDSRTSGNRCKGESVITTSGKKYVLCHRKNYNCFWLAIWEKRFEPINGEMQRTLNFTNQHTIVALKVTANQHSSKFGADKEHQVKRYTEVSDKCNHGIPFWKWEISLEHYKRGYSGPGLLGEFVVVLLMWFLGAPSVLIIMLLLILKKCTWVLQGIFT